MKEQKNCLNIKVFKYNEYEIKSSEFDIIVILDIFRASSTMYYLFNKGIERIYPVASTKDALKIKKDIKDSMLVGEEKGIKPKKFDFGNSPSEISNSNIHCKNTIMSTSSGTKAILKYDNNIIIGSLLNINAIVDYILINNYINIGICVTNVKDDNKYNEDYICARYIYSNLKNKSYNILSKIKVLEKYKNNRFFKEKLQTIFPKEDYYLCTKLNLFNFVLKYNGEYIKKVV